MFPGARDGFELLTIIENVQSIDELDWADGQHDDARQFWPPKSRLSSGSGRRIAAR